MPALRAHPSPQRQQYHQLGTRMEGLQLKRAELPVSWALRNKADESAEPAGTQTGQT